MLCLSLWSSVKLFASTIIVMQYNVFYLNCIEICMLCNENRFAKWQMLRQMVGARSLLPSGRQCKCYCFFNGVLERCLISVIVCKLYFFQQPNSILRVVGHFETLRNNNLLSNPNKLLIIE